MVKLLTFPWVKKLKANKYPHKHKPRVPPTAEMLNHSRLLHLPTELRLIILEYAVGWNGIQDCLSRIKDQSSDRDSFKSALTPDIQVACQNLAQNSLLLVNRQLAREVLYILQDKPLILPAFMFLSLTDIGLTELLQLLIKSIREKLKAFYIILPESTITLKIEFRITTWSSNFGDDQNLVDLVASLKAFAKARGFPWITRFDFHLTNERVINTAREQRLIYRDFVDQRREDTTFFRRQCVDPLCYVAQTNYTHENVPDEESYRML
jgi:hypothetical protein